mmetsp:Transcript_20162/g.30321  ORF Transcript_20162/g.30321 Transcript_20162/m.30321 type:complete len:80 (+) Transcript_20162:2253-2492(+)|eukprot:CAMPEP_0178901066 /NCGR_PEP_ID=MMETSP0786-20121207/3810_1 /TAXON_ID=186022 /ORGANISM="Thalassionema frauenfeldii, Strain CCMP 1798" /LENGTH=79 /DNA_ID=CAMNT_0020572115 /DNA_START=2396 /DNA_END=2635 /DNA_ORIENTATION=-
MTIVPSLVTKAAIVAKGKGNTWIDTASEQVLFTLNQKAFPKSHTLVLDAGDHVVATIKIGANICWSSSHDTEELKRAGI